GRPLRSRKGRAVAGLRGARRDEGVSFDRADESIRSRENAGEPAASFRRKRLRVAPHGPLVGRRRIADSGAARVCPNRWPPGADARFGTHKRTSLKTELKRTLVVV